VPLSPSRAPLSSRVSKARLSKASRRRSRRPRVSPIRRWVTLPIAEAQAKVEEVKGEYQSQVQAASEDPQKAMDVQREAQQEMVKAVKETGLDVRKYNQIAQLAQYDTDLRERIQENM
jgi:predicted ATPase with chaperone activity